MTVWLSCYPREILVVCPAVSDGGTRGTLRKTVRPGDDFYDFDYDTLRRLGDGKHELDVKPTAGKGRAAI